MDEQHRRELAALVDRLMPSKSVMDAVASQVRLAENVRRAAALDLTAAIRGIPAEALVPIQSNVVSGALAALASPAIVNAIEVSEGVLRSHMRGVQASVLALGPRTNYETFLSDYERLLGGGVFAELMRLSAFQQDLARQYSQTLALMRPVLPDVVASVTEQLRGYFASRTFLQWAVARELSSRSWWLVPGWDDALLRRLLSALHEHRGQRAVVAVLRAHYERYRCRALGKMVFSWTLPELGTRKRLLRSALAAYRRRDYVAAVKVLNGAEEAVLKEFLIRTARITEGTARQKGAPALLKVHVTDGRPALVPFERAFAELFTGFTWGTRWGGDQLKRHRLAHGAVPQNRAALALRQFLILDTLDHFLSRLP